jgi:hypothetical protein
MWASPVSASKMHAQYPLRASATPMLEVMHALPTPPLPLVNART